MDTKTTFVRSPNEIHVTLTLLRQAALPVLFLCSSAYIYIFLCIRVFSIFAQFCVV